MLKPVHTLTLAVALALPTGAFAQETTRIDGFVFGPDGLPLGATSVEICGVPLVTDTQGSFALTTAAGNCELRIDGHTQSFTVAGATAEILVRVGPEGMTVDAEGAQVSQDATPVESAQTAWLRGVVVDEVGRPVGQAQVFVQGVVAEIRTDNNGSFEVEVPAQGVLLVSVVHPNFSAYTQSLPEVPEPGPLHIALEPNAVELQEFVVTAPRIEGSALELLAERKDSSQVMEVLGAEEMSKTGASDAADALSRVTGITLVGGKYVYVRGLGDRYSATLINRAHLPSPEPERRVVPLDLFPTDLLESVTVQKNYSADLPGEFGGGTVELRTRRHPSVFEAGVGLSTGVRLGSTFEDVAWNQSGSLDFLGIDDGTRALPENVAQASANAPLLPGDRFSTYGYPESELETLGESFNNTWETTYRTLPPNGGFDLTLGDRFELGATETGYRLGLNWSQDFAQQASQKTYYVVGASGLEPRNTYDFTTAEREVVLGGMFTTGLKFDAHELTLTTFLNRISSDETRIYSGFNRDAGADISVTRYRWIERTLAFGQLAGKHPLRGTEVDWRYAYSVALRGEPDRREFRYDMRDGGLRLSDRPEGNSRVFSELVDAMHDLGADVAVPWGNVTLKAGVAGTLKSREVDTRRYKYQGETLGDVFYEAPQNIFVPANIGPDAALQFREATRSTDNYVADQTLLAGYGLAEGKWGAWSATAGLRLEYSRQSVDTFELFNPNADAVRSELETIDPLPSMSIAWEFIPNHVVRAAGSQTVSRPDFRELSPLLFNDVAGGRAVAGNPELERAQIRHVDLRYEYFPNPGEVLAVSAFGKLFDSPIESELQAGAQPLLTFQNASGATNLGAEIEARKGLGFLQSWLHNLSVGANASFIHSRVELAPGGNQTNAVRPLQGQSPYVLNASIGWDDADTSTSIVALYNVVGRRIDSVGSSGAPDIYEESAGQLDVVAKKKLGSWKLGLKATNLLDPAVEYTQGGQVTETHRDGRKFSVSVGYDW